MVINSFVHLEGWHQPSDITGFDGFNYWLLLIPLGLLLLTLGLPLIKYIPNVLAYVLVVILGLSTVASAWFITVKQPELNEQALQKSYLSWFHENYKYLDLTDEDALETLQNRYGFLDKEHKRHLMLEEKTSDGLYYIYYISENTPLTYRLAPQKASELGDTVN